MFKFILPLNRNIPKYLNTEPVRYSDVHCTWEKKIVYVNCLYRINGLATFYVNRKTKFSDQPWYAIELNLKLTK